jgi:small-conductance mechanosensitive channel
MTFLETTFYHNTLQKWIVAVGIAAAVWAILVLLRHVVHRKLATICQRTASPLDDLLALLIQKIKTSFGLAVALYAGSLALALPGPVAALLRKLIFLAILLQAAVWGTEIVTFSIGQSGRKKGTADGSNKAALGLVHFGVRVVLWSFVVLLALDNFGVHITTLIAGLGVSGIAVALAAQSVLGDLFASIAIVLDKPFAIGDFITVDDLLGTVEQIGIKTTRIRSLSGEELIFTNSDLLKSRIHNYKRMAERRVLFGFGVVYQTPAEKLAAIPSMVKEIVGEQAKARFDRAHFKQFGASSLDFEVVYYVTAPDYNLFMDVQQAINMGLVRRFQAEGIEFAYPTQSVFVTRQDAAGT